MASRAVAKKKRESATADRDDLVFKALANRDRRIVLDLIREAPLTTSEISAQLDWLDRCTVMQHLRVLEAAELVISRKRGRCRWHYLNVEPIQRVHTRWIKAYAQPAARLLSALKQQLEAE